VRIWRLFVPGVWEAAAMSSGSPADASRLVRGAEAVGRDAYGLATRAPAVSTSLAGRSIEELHDRSSLGVVVT